MEPFIFAVDLTEPSGFTNTTWTAPPPPSRGAPTARSSAPSPSRSPMLATEDPNRSPSDRSGPFEVEPFIFAVEMG